MSKIKTLNHKVKPTVSLEAVLRDGRIVRSFDAAKLDAITALSYREMPMELYEDSWTAAAQIGDEIYVRVAADQLTADALVTLKTIIRRRHVNYIRVAVDAQWRRTTIEGVAAHIVEAELSKLIMSEDRAVWSNYFTRDLRAADANDRVILAAAAELWAMRDEKWNVRNWCTALDQRGFNRYVVTEYIPDTRDFRFVRAGGGLQDAKSGWFSSSVGKPVSRMPDRDYASHVIEDYVKPVSNWLPRLQRVVSRVHWSANDWIDRDYLRLALPVGTAGHSGPLLLTITTDYNSTCSA